ncbi:PREDICTED: activating signal cointegrator 1-like [Amphimedon queenslandica]|nr:PREDICTED: activating signal cointegrator 1-like [Amphimedon queenslandica]|eukprot:XP_019857131.1 PREDICTED: activating signal cointegrator 1-like [Amphimedon queenslandica]
MEEDADAITSGSPSKRREVYEDSHSFLCNPMVPVSPPKYLGAKKRKGGGGGKERDSVVPMPRLQDPNLMEMTDKGVCLSMHQPWASLLVCGIKRHEGRSWYTSHRGKLWIASTAKEPDPAVIKDLESFYKDYYEDSGEITFPSSYPSGCLLGCVEVSDCLNRDEYTDKYPNGESESQFVFICHSPQELLIKQPIKGKHKLWRLPRDVHNAAKRTLNYSS